MTLRQITLLAALTTLAVLGLASSASAATVWNLDIHHNETNFPPGGKAQYWFDVNNVGDTPSDEAMTLTIQLPPGLTRSSIMEDTDAAPLVIWSCPGSAGQTTIVCTTNDSVPRHTLTRRLILEVAIDPAASSDLITTAELKGGGAAAAVTASEPTHVSSTPASFGILPESFVPGFFKADGIAPQQTSGGHPDLLTVPFDLTSISTPKTGSNNAGGVNNASNPIPIKREAETLRNVVVDLPPGFLGDPTAVGECTAAEFQRVQCPVSSQVGRFDAHIYPYDSSSLYQVTTGVFNMAHPRGSISDLAFVIGGNPVHVRVSLDPANGYAIRSTVSNINESLPAFDSKVTIWGIPADPSHDSERCATFSTFEGVGDTQASCSTDIERKPFLTMPFQCGIDNTMRVHGYDSWQDSGDFGPDISYDLPGQTTDCDKPRFNPSVQASPTGSQANTPAGLDVGIRVPQNKNPNAVYTPPIESTVVTLPQGMTVNPAFADGLTGCSLDQIGLGTGDAVACPDSSRIGEVDLTTPLLPEPLKGSIYLAKQEDNPFGSLLAIYLAIHDTEERGVLVKVPGRIDLDPTTGQITSTFENLPQFPFDELSVKFRSGPRAPLVNPPTCGTHTIAVKMTSYAQPDKQLDVSNDYQVTEGPGGSACIADAARRPFDPELVAGTLSPVAGEYSPLALRLSRTDAEQEFSSVEAVAPPGLIASLKGIEQCSEAQIAAAAARSQPGQGVQEIATPSCPISSQVGVLSTGAGAGPDPIYVPGKVYLAGPYKGAPLSGVAVVPAVAGPVDLGVVVVRSPAYVDRRTAQVRIVTDRLPQIFNGVLLRVRDVRVNLDRPHFTLNPTSCSPMSIDANVFSNLGALAFPSTRFQVGECAALGFKPHLKLRLDGGTKRGAYPKLRATLRMPQGGANVGRASVALPHSAFLAQEHIRTICTRVQFAADACPTGSIYGSAIAKTPLFSEPLRGPVVLRSSRNPLPDMVAILRGPASLPVEVDLVGRVDSVNGGIRNTFDVVPDAPVETFTLQLRGGKKSLLVNSRDLCTGTNRANAKFTGQNGRSYNFRPVVVPANCAKKSKAKRSAHRGAG
jgi:hypothetical protein